MRSLIKISDQYELMKNGKPYCFDWYLDKIQMKCANQLKKIDRIPYGHPKRNLLIKKILATYGENNIIKEGFKCTFGSNISIGNECFFNFNVTILDSYEVVIGNNVQIGPNVVISAVTHSLEIENRKQSIGGKIVIEDNVWIGAGAIILSNIKVGKGAVVGAGAVVTKDVPPHTIVAGIPAKEIKKIN